MSDSMLLLTFRELRVAARVLGKPLPPVVNRWAEQFGYDSMDSDPPDPSEVVAVTEAASSLLLRGVLQLVDESPAVPGEVATVLEPFLDPRWSWSVLVGPSNQGLPQLVVRGRPEGATYAEPNGSGGLILRHSDDPAAAVENLIRAVIGDVIQRYPTDAKDATPVPLQNLLEELDPETGTVVTLVVAETDRRESKTWFRLPNGQFIIDDEGDTAIPVTDSEVLTRFLDCAAIAS